MNTPMIHDDFLLSTEYAQRLYHEYAARLPIIDYHCHLDPEALATDCSFDSLTELWLDSDPYKHRAMRIAGVPEQCITGDADPREKFNQWAATLPKTLGNPLHHWSALELKRYFDIDEPLCPDSAGRIWQTCNAALGTPVCSARNLISRSNVACICTSDSLLDNLTAHEQLAASDFNVRVLPSLRCDEALHVDAATFTSWLNRLGESTNQDTSTLNGFVDAIAARLDHFNALGCRLADHGLDTCTYISVSDVEAARLFQKRRSGQMLDANEQTRLRSALLRFLVTGYADRGWTMQLHIGAQRQTSSRLRQLAGPAGGYAMIGQSCDIPNLARLLDDLESQNCLPRTILYPLNPVDYQALASITGSFAEDNVAGKVQLGPAWWFNDHRPGIEQQLQAIANYSLLSVFVGMTTDSRSLLSMVRHEYFRRVLCDWLGRRMQKGELPTDVTEVGRLVTAVAYDNVHRQIMEQSEL